MSSPSTPSPAAHHFARLCQRSGRGTGGHLVRFWAMSSPPHRHTSPPIDQQPATTRQRLDVLPSCPPRPLPLRIPSSGEEGKRKRANRTGREERAKDASDIFARSSLPSSSAVPVILRHDLVRSLSSVRPSVFLFLVPRSPSCILTAKPTPAAHYLTSSPPRHGWNGSPGSGRDTIATTSPPTSNRDGRTSARPSDRLSLPV